MKRFANNGEIADPYEQRRVMPSAAVFCLVRGGVVVERCA
jgi:hypothetical protein